MSRNLTRVASTALVAGLASLVLAGPADAMMTHDPDVGVDGMIRAGNNTGLGTPTQAPAAATGEGNPWMDLGIGALGGLALAGAGTAAASRVRHRQFVAT